MPETSRITNKYYQKHSSSEIEALIWVPWNRINICKKRRIHKPLLEYPM